MSGVVGCFLAFELDRNNACVESSIIGTASDAVAATTAAEGV